MTAEPRQPMFVIFASYGNDSIALLQWAVENELQDVAILYSNTGWAADWWELRKDSAVRHFSKHGFTFHETSSVGMKELVTAKKGWPRQGLQFCTYELKIKPALEWLNIEDPLGLSVCMVGVRREESKTRENFPVFTPGSENHGGRTLWAPLAEIKEPERNALISRAGFEVLPHRSMECFPCINSNRSDLLLLAEEPERVSAIASIEEGLGFTSKGKPRTMFRPYRYMGATGIKEIIRWAKSDRGKFDPDDGNDGPGCDSGFCGS